MGRVGYAVFTLVLVLLLYATWEFSRAGPATSSNYYTLCMGSDCFKNWDSSSETVFGPSTADWPVTIIYWGYATISKVKDRYDWDFPFAWKRYMLMTDDGVTWFTASDRGMKTVNVVFDPPQEICNRSIGREYIHVRLYADPSRGYNYHPSLGRYVVATTHIDDWPLEEWAGFAELGEIYALKDARKLGWSVLEDYYYGYNADFRCREEGRHVNLNDGFISYVYVPP